MVDRKRSSQLAFLVPIACGAFAVIGLGACKAPNGVGARIDGVESPTTIRLGTGSAESVSDYQASVKVFYSNDRVALPPKLSQSYRLSTKNIDGSLFVRLDYDENAEFKVAKRSVITGPEETLVLSADSNMIEQRIPVKEALKGQLAVGQKSLFSRVDIAGLRSKMVELGYDAADEKGMNDGHVIVFSAPAGLLPKGSAGNATARSFKVRFDADMGVMAGSELVEVRNDGCVVTKVVEKYYQEKDGIAVPVGERTDVRYDYPYALDVDASANQTISDPASLPKISQEEFQKLKAQGAAYELPMPTLGDPSDPDYTETWTTVYESLETNCLSESLFVPSEVR